METLTLKKFCASRRNRRFLSTVVTVVSSFPVEHCTDILKAV